MQNSTARKLAQIPSNHLIVGIDPHKRRHAVAIMTAQATICTKFKIDNSRQGFEHLIRRVHAETAKSGSSGALFSIEAGAHYWRNLAYYLEEHQFFFRLVSPLTLKRQREGQDLTRQKNDFRDATMAAELMRTGKFTETHLLEGAYAELRALNQAYRRLRREYTRSTNILRGLLDGLFPEFCQVFKEPCGQSAMTVLLTCPIPSVIASMSEDDFIRLLRPARIGMRLAIKKLRELHQVAASSSGIKAGMHAVTLEIQQRVAQQLLLGSQLAELERNMLDLFAQFPERACLMSVTGLGELTAIGLVAEIGPLEYYRDSKTLVKLAGVNPIQNESADKGKKYTPISKKGRSGLRNCLWQGALSLLRSNEEFKAWAKELADRAPHKNPLHRREVLGAAMNKLLRLYFALVSKGQYYRPSQVVRETVAA